MTNSGESHQRNSRRTGGSPRAARALFKGRPTSRYPAASSTAQYSSPSGLGRPPREGEPRRHLRRGDGARDESRLEQKGGRRAGQFLLHQAGGQDSRVGDQYTARPAGQVGEQVVLAGDELGPPPGHHPPAPERVPEVRVGEHPAGLLGRDQRAEPEAEALGQGPIGLGDGQGDLMPPSPQFHPKADVREDVPVGAQACEDGMHGGRNLRAGTGRWPREQGRR